MLLPGARDDKDSEVTDAPDKRTGSLRLQLARADAAFCYHAHMTTHSFSSALLLPVYELHESQAREMPVRGNQSEPWVMSKLTLYCIDNLQFWLKFHVIN